MPEADYHTLDKTLDLVCKTFPEGVINTVEIGVHKGNGSRGIHKFFEEKSRLNFHTAIDNNHDLTVDIPFTGCNLIIGNSYEVYNQLADNSQHFGLIDGNHSYPITLVDFLVYSDKIRIGGLVAFHDTGKQIPAYKDYQHLGSRSDPDMFIACRKAVKKLGLLDNKHEGWKLIYDEFDPNFDTGGIVVVQKIK